MLPSFLTTQQIEELETFGTLELTDDLMEDIFSWTGESSEDNS